MSILVEIEVADMKYADYRARLEQDADFQQAQADLHTVIMLGNALLRARLGKGWSQSELARRVGTQQANISRIEAGMANPTLHLVQSFCEALGLELLIQPRLAQTGQFQMLDQRGITAGNYLILVHLSAFSGLAFQ